VRGKAGYTHQISFSGCLLVLLLCCCVLLTSCLESRLPEGVVATVNGEAIHLRTVQALLDSRSGALGMLRRPTLANLKDLYGDALSTLIVQTLIRQELERRQLQVSEAELDEALRAVRDDYSQEGLATHLTELSLDELHWRFLMRDLLAVQKFEKLLLQPAITVSLDEVRAYYAHRQKDFLLPAVMELCFVSAESRDEVEDFGSAFALQKQEAKKGVMVQHMDVQTEDIPLEWAKAVARLKPRQCAPPRAVGQNWQSICLKERRTAHVMLLAEAFPLVERILREEKKDAVFEAWLEKSVADTEIRISPLLLETVLP